MLCKRYSVPASDSARYAKKKKSHFQVQALELKEVKGKRQTHGWLDWSNVHLDRNTADAAITEGRKFKKP